MEVVINNYFGRSKIPQEFLDKYNGYYDRNLRTDKEFIQWVKDNEEKTNLRIVVITEPNEVTDWLIEDYDGLEIIFYVVDGKIWQA